MKKLNLILFILLLVACREDESVPASDSEKVDIGKIGSISGFYLLNEGNMGSNKSTLDYFDYETGYYKRNIYSVVNSGSVKELGDVGTAIGIYGGKLYAVINCSDKITIMNAYTAEKLGEISIPNCRYIAFHGGYAYISSYAGPVQVIPNYKQYGYIAKIDTASLELVDSCVVGFQPDELTIANNKIYVANSGGYMKPNYENTVSVIDIFSFSEIKRIEVAINLHRICADSNGYVWVSSRGDYANTQSRLYYIDSKEDMLIDSIDIPVSNFYLDDSKLYTCSAVWNNVAYQNEIVYGIVDVQSKQVLTKNFIKDGSENQIKVPYCVSVNPASKDIYITDAKDYVYPGTLYCYNSEGVYKWQVRTGDIPGSICYLYKSLINGE